MIQSEVQEEQRFKTNSQGLRDPWDTINIFDIYVIGDLEGEEIRHWCRKIIF